VADGDPLIIASQNQSSGASPTVLQGGPSEFISALVVNLHGDGGAAALTATAPDNRPGVAGTGMPGVQGRQSNPGGTGVAGSSDSGFAITAHSVSGTGLRATSDHSFGISAGGGNVGVFAERFNSQHRAFLATDCCAADLFGPVSIHGNLSLLSAALRIDHPQDPANRYLLHSVVASSESKNIYDGTTDLDASGEATVEMPSWFEALNGEYRYQLTAIGGPAPALHIAEELANGRFKIAGGTPGGRVSWHVTGIRKDAWAQAHAAPVEVDKPDDERGSYLAPELFGATAELSIRARHYPDLPPVLTSGDES
jgi:hypothetical protein